MCAGDGLGLWQSTHRDDCGKLFAYAALNSKTYGEAYFCAHGFLDGAREKLTDLRQHGAWCESATDVDYQSLVDPALSAGMTIEEA